MTVKVARCASFNCVKASLIMYQALIISINKLIDDKILFDIWFDAINLMVKCQNYNLLLLKWFKSNNYVENKKLVK